MSDTAAAVRPTHDTYQSLEQFYDFFNQVLFDSTLPGCLITLQRKEKRVHGYFSPERFQNAAAEHTHEIAMNPMHFLNQPLREILGTLVHEMVHLQQHCYGKPSRAGYHNCEWGQLMKEVGLYPSSTAEPGGNEVGQKMSHYIIEDGPFDRAFKAMEGARLDWGEMIRVEAKPKNKSHRTKYTCPACAAAAWGKPELSLICGSCERPMLGE